MRFAPNAMKGPTVYMYISYNGKFSREKTCALQISQNFAGITFTVGSVSAKVFSLKIFPLYAI